LQVQYRFTGFLHLALIERPSNDFQGRQTSPQLPAPIRPISW
jgi:hypothetical protein